MTAPETDLALMRIFQTRVPECLKCCWGQANVVGVIGSDDSHKEFHPLDFPFLYFDKKILN